MGEGNEAKGKMKLQEAFITGVVVGIIATAIIALLAAFASIR